MGPNSDRQPELNINPGQIELGGVSSEVDPSSVIKASSPEINSGNETKPTSTMVSTSPIEPVLSSNPILLANSDQSQMKSPQGGNPIIADDNDLIEKDWVDKAKDIVLKTRHDPFLESKEINAFKADYLKKRYNKVLKVREN